MNDTEIPVVLTAAEWNVVGAALGELPFKVSRPIFDKIQAQIAQALQPADPPPAD